ncbi:response regulator [Pseudomonas syringae]|nr:response regulator [Pseudomonas syringae]MCF5071602.1 response regulator [Pseudomonas syringae]
MKSALIADDHPVVRATVRMILEKEKYTRIQEAASGNEVISMLREHTPRLVILDLHLPGLDGLEVLARIKANELTCRVLVFTSYEPAFYQERCLRAGAMGYVTKTNELEQLRNAVRALDSGYSYFTSPAMSTGAMGTLQLSEKQMIDRLSDRELCIFIHLAEGMANKDIAELMILSIKTVSTYKHRLMTKLGVGSTVHLRDFATRNHLI